MLFNFFVVQILNINNHFYNSKSKFLLSVFVPLIMFLVLGPFICKAQVGNVAYPVQSALKNNKTGNNNSAFGENALQNNLSGSANTAIGVFALNSNIESNNTAVGFSSLYLNSSGVDNTAVGAFSMYSNTTGSYNAAVGTNSLRSNKGNGNTGVGYDAMRSNTNGWYNTALGASALYSNTYQSYNTADGYQALFSNVDGINNTATGVYALKSNTKGQDNTAFGFEALKANTVGNYNSAIGNDALANNVYGVSNTAAGSNALYANVSGNWNTAVGAYALYNNTASYNTAVGDSALFKNMGGSGNTAIGVYSLSNNTEGINNTAIGSYSLSSNITGSNNCAMGLNTLNNSFGDNNVAIGDSAGFSTLGYGNIFIGFKAGYNEIGSNKLYINNGLTNFPLIYGDFASGFVGIKTTKPLSPLSIDPSSDGAKIDLFDNGNASNFCGFSISANNKQFNYHILDNLFSHAFYAGGVNGDGIELMRIKANGMVGIGTSSPTALLTVNGSMLIGDPTKIVNLRQGHSLYVTHGLISEKITLAAANSINWADYVFDEKYKLQTLNEIKKYIKENKHLPGVPSAKEVIEGGLDIAKIDAKLMEKIEELYLYVIRIQKENACLQKMLDESN